MILPPKDPRWSYQNRWPQFTLALISGLNLLVLAVVYLWARKELELGQTRNDTPSIK